MEKPRKRAVLQFLGPIEAQAPKVNKKLVYDQEGDQGKRLNKVVDKWNDLMGKGFPDAPDLPDTAFPKPKQRKRSSAGEKAYQEYLRLNKYDMGAGLAKAIDRIEANARQEILKAKGGAKQPGRARKMKKKQSNRSSVLSRPVGGKAQIAREEERRKAVIAKQKERAQLEKLIKKEREREKRYRSKRKVIHKKRSQRPTGVRKHNSKRKRVKRTSNGTEDNIRQLWAGENYSHFAKRYGHRSTRRGRNRIRKSDVLGAISSQRRLLKRQGHSVRYNKNKNKARLLSQMKKWM